MSQSSALIVLIFMSRPIRAQEINQTVGVSPAPHLWTSWRLFDTNRKQREKRHELTIKLRQFHQELLHCSCLSHSDSEEKTLGKHYRMFKAGFSAFMWIFGVCERWVYFGGFCSSRSWGASVFLSYKHTHAPIHANHRETRFISAWNNN